MHYRFAVCLFVASSAAGCNQHTRVVGVPQQPITAVVTDDGQLEKLSLDELIDRLPLAGSEWLWDDSQQGGKEHPASREMSRRLIAGATLSDDQWRRALLGTEAIRHPQRWPNDTPYRLYLAVPRWLDVTQIRLEARGIELGAVKAGATTTPFCGTCDHALRLAERQGMLIGALPEGTTELIFDVEVERGTMRRNPHRPVSPTPGILWKGTITLPVELIDAAVADDEQLENLSLDELIDRLPPAGKEWRWDHALEDGVEHPASQEMRRRLLDGAELSDDQWRRALLGTGAIRYRHRWPKDESYRLSLTVPRWLDLAQIRLDAHGTILRPVEVGERFWSFSGTFPMMRARDARVGVPMGTLPEGTSELVFLTEVERGDSLWPKESQVPQPGILWKGTITLPVELVDSIEEMTKAIDNDTLQAAVRDAVGAGFRDWGRHDNVPVVVIDPDCDRFPILKTTGLVVRVELLQDDTVIAESWLVAMDSDTLSLASSIRNSSYQFFGSANLKIDDVETDPTYWVLRLTGKNDHIQYLWHAENHWSGELTIPWTEAVEHEQKRTADHGRGPEMSTPHLR